MRAQFIYALILVAVGVVWAIAERKRSDAIVILLAAIAVAFAQIGIVMALVVARTNDEQMQRIEHLLLRIAKALEADQPDV